MLAIRGPGDGSDTSCMADIGQQRLASGRVPDLHRGIKAGRGQLCSVRGPGDSRDPIGVTVVRQFMVSCEALPDLHSFVKTGRGSWLPSGDQATAVTVSEWP